MCPRRLRGYVELAQAALRSAIGDKPCAGPNMRARRKKRTSAPPGVLTCKERTALESSALREGVLRWDGGGARALFGGVGGARAALGAGRGKGLSEARPGPDPGLMSAWCRPRSSWGYTAFEDAAVRPAAQNRNRVCERWGRVGWGTQEPAVGP